MTPTPPDIVVSAVILTMGNRNEMLARVLEQLRDEPIDEILIVNNGPAGAVTGVAEADLWVRVIEAGSNLGIAGRNLGARQAEGRYLLLLDDDSYPLPGTVGTLLEKLRADERLAVATGMVRDVDEDGGVLAVDQLGTFDWFFRAGRRGPIGPDGLPVDFFAEGASLLRRGPFLEVGGFFEPYFFAQSEVDVTTRLIKRGWDVRYFPEAPFDHMKPEGHLSGQRKALFFRIRNNAWYLWLHFPLGRAIPRIAGYLAFDLLEAVYRGVPGAWARAVRAAWKDREVVRHARDPVPPELVPRIEIHRGRLHVRLLLAQMWRKGSHRVRRLVGRTERT